MKIGTDGVLLGAWAPIREAKRVLDVGTGCGIVALMLAQRTVEIGSLIAAIDIEEEAAVQSVENFADSPWSDRLPGGSDHVHQSLAKFSLSDFRFDLIVCNPPFFDSPGCMSDSDSSRKIARHATETDRRHLIQGMRGLLEDEGRLCLILPFEQAGATVQMSKTCGLHLWSRTDVRPTPDSRPKRTLLELATAKGDHDHNELIVETERHQFSQDYANLTRHFHLRYAIE